MLLLLILASEITRRYGVRTPLVDFTIHYAGGFIVVCYVVFWGHWWPWWPRFREWKLFTRCWTVLIAAMLGGVGVEVLEYLDHVQGWNLIPGDHSGLTWETKKDLFADALGALMGTTAYLTWFWIQGKKRKEKG